MGTKVLATGFYVPENIVTNKDLEKLFDTSDEWIVQRSGIKERRYASEHEASSDLALNASKMALERCGLTANDLDFIVVASTSNDMCFPATSSFLQMKLGLDRIPAVDLQAQCSGFVYAMTTADAFLKAKKYKTILVVGVEVLSKVLDLSDEGRDTAVLFGDGAGAAVLQYDETSDSDFLSTVLRTRGSEWDKLYISKPGTIGKEFISPQDCEDKSTRVKMDGRAVFKNAVKLMPEAINESLKEANVNPDDISMYFFHQANLRINNAALEVLGQPPEKAWTNVMKYGNTSAASIAISMGEAFDTLKRGDLLCMGAFGAGFTWGAITLRW